MRDPVLVDEENGRFQLIPQADVAAFFNDPMTVTLFFEVFM